MKKIKVGIIGTGGISHLHTQSYQKLDRVEIVAACDINAERVQAYAKKYHIPNIFTDYRELLKITDLDAVSVTSWNNSHAEISIAALKAGKHVLCEKPLALNAVQALEMVKTAEACGKILMVGFVKRFSENAKLMKEAIENGELGNIYYAKTGYLRRRGNPGGWFSDLKRSGGGPVIDLGVHMIDLVRYLSGKPQPVSVSAQTFREIGAVSNKGIQKYTSADYSNYNDVEDGATALIRFDNGLTLIFETSWNMNIKADYTYLNLYGNKAGAQIEPELEIYEQRNGYLQDAYPKVNEENNAVDYLFNQEIAHFADCIENDTPCINPASDGLVMMKIIDAIYESAKTGKEVYLKEGQK